MLFTQQIRDAIRAYLKARHLSPSAYAEKVGLDPKTVLRWVNSEKAESIRPSNYAKIAKDIEPYLEKEGDATDPTMAHIRHLERQTYPANAALLDMIAALRQDIHASKTMPAEDKLRLLARLDGAPLPNPNDTEV